MKSNCSKRDPVFQHLSVPYLCNYEQFCSSSDSFLHIPEQFGLHWDTAHHPELTGLNTETAPEYLQGWLFFAFLSKACSIFGVELKPLDLIVSSGDSETKYVSGRELSKYVWLWYGANFTKDWDSQLKILDEFKRYLDIFNKVTNAWIEQTVVETTPDLDRILLSLAVLGDSLTYALSQFPQNETVLKAGLYTWKCSPSLQTALLDSGWCKGELNDLYGRCRRPTVLLYLSTLDRRYLAKNHSQCTEDICYANQLNENAYEQGHTQDCERTSCQKVFAPVDDIKAILRDGAIPIVRIASHAGNTGVTLEAERFELGNRSRAPAYVAISHVWSDGMGNPSENALPECELRRIQRCVDNLDDSPSEQPSQHLFFWMDTLCVPLEAEYRNLAIIRMAKTYFHASKVLVLDNWLRFDMSGSDTSESDPRKILFKIAFSTWTTRLWTYQESVLAQKRQIQYGDSAYTITDLQDQVKMYDNLQAVSDCLSTMDTSSLFQSEGAMNLIKAIICSDPTAEKFVSYYASLPPQEDEDEEELRLQALKMQPAAAKRKALGDEWRPVFEESDQVSDDWYGEDWIRKHIQSMNPILDPVYGHARQAAQALRGNLYSVMSSRENDSKAGEERQLTSFSSPPDIILMDASRGLPGRMTSKLEDETICLGGIIGLDVTPMLAIKSPKDNNPVELLQAREERMKVFLSLVKRFAPSILFWESERLSTYPWRWAPLSFLDRRSCVHSYTDQRAELTKEGLLGTWYGIRIKPSQHTSFERRFRTLRLQWIRKTKLTEGSDAYHFYRSWEDLELHPETTDNEHTLADFFVGQYRDLGLIISDQANLEGVLVDIVREDSGRILYAHYLANIARRKIDDEPERLESYVDAEWMGRRRWCVG